MRVAVLTGGIASGKSTVCRIMKEFLPSVEIFDCDAAVRRMLDSDPAVATTLAQTFGENVIDAEGKVDRDFLRNSVFQMMPRG
ncbi:MAG: dephospho-CoA kinase [Akkermansiaceae bacterium]|nr:dephospho-CoA kinase [Akkermansiaceae bacterium]